MKKYTVTGYCTIMCGMTVEAENEDEALQIANDEFGGLISYAGNGGDDKLLGVAGRSKGQWIAPDGEPEFDECRVCE